MLGRFERTVERHDPEMLVRVTADCPLISPAVLDRVVERLDDTDRQRHSSVLDSTIPEAREDPDPGPVTSGGRPKAAECATGDRREPRTERPVSNGGRRTSERRTVGATTGSAE